MKAPDFRYVRAQSLQHAYAVLRHHRGAAVPLAGGQSLLAGLNMRVASPEVVLDINNLPELSLSRFDGNEIRLGALTRHIDILQSAQLQERIPLLPEAVTHIAHAGIRNRGTLGGSLAYADPAAELPACAVALDATIVIGGPDGERQLKADQFFTGLMETALQSDELILAVRIPVPAAPMHYSFGEFARRRGDFAVAGLVATAQLHGGQLQSARFVYFGCVERVQVATCVSSLLIGQAFPVENRAAVSQAVADDLEPDDTPGWRAETKLRLAQVLTNRALDELAQMGISR